MKKLQLRNASVQTRRQEEYMTALKIRQHLQFSSEQLDKEVSSRLRAVRERALDSQKKEQDALIIAQSPVYQGAEVLAMSAPWWKQNLAWAVPVLMLVLTLFGANQWQEGQYIDELAEIDALILADDLPLDAHLDPGFITTLQTRD
jgi:hypothetical protein